MENLIVPASEKKAGIRRGGHGEQVSIIPMKGVEEFGTFQIEQMQPWTVGHGSAVRADEGIRRTSDPLDPNIFPPFGADIGRLEIGGFDIGSCDFDVFLLRM